MKFLKDLFCFVKIMQFMQCDDIDTKPASIVTTYLLTTSECMCR